MDKSNVLDTLVKGTAKFPYDFSIDGGAVGNIVLNRGGLIPSGATIVGGIFNLKSAITGPAGTKLKLKLEADQDLQGDSLVSDLDLSVVGAFLAVPAAGNLLFNGSPTIMNTTGSYPLILATANRYVTLSPSIHALTGGKFDLYLDYLYLG